MNRYLTLSVLILLTCVTAASAQRRTMTTSIGPAPEIFVFGGYALNGGTDAIVGVQPGRINVTDGAAFGGSIAIPARPGTNVEISYLYNSSGYIFEPTLGIPDDEVSMGVHYIQIGGQQYLPNGNVFPYGSFTVGTAIFAPSQGSTNWEFAVTGGVGVKNYINEKVAIRVDARLLLPIFWGGVGFYCGTGGCGGGAGGTVGMWSGSFTGGIVYRLGQ